jgi:hypothetical protein
MQAAEEDLPFENIGAIMTDYKVYELQEDPRRVDEGIPKRHISTD